MGVSSLRKKQSYHVATGLFKLLSPFFFLRFVRHLHPLNVIMVNLLRLMNDPDPLDCIQEEYDDDF